MSHAAERDRPQAPAFDVDPAIRAIAERLEAEPRIRALALGGSHGAGLADAYSDLDFLVVADSGASDQTAALWRDALGRVGEIVLWRDRQVKPTLINAITAAWLRVDVDIVTPQQIAERTKAGLRILFDPDELLEALPAKAEKPRPSPGRLQWQVEEFFRVLGLLPLAMGRAEYFNSVTGLFFLRNLITDLLIEETGAPNRGGVLHLNRLITAEQKKALAALPPLVAERDALIANYLAHAALYLPRARKMAARLGARWPERFEAVTWEHLHDTLGIEPPPVVRASRRP
ncbi:nucleotidyltransferase domain-containing protein [Kaistia nematophila]|uniref:Nucleotidyltransferase domain-containing protein n=1 Tax=Kaistia nematophila TaxID=2994654 RepID=A0A9X3IJ93_9HYPH|nr:nucleotidyltransferase domain-containing protein [Kaistia nematophila]MCX5568309.1 nucleotidyltransferase domain-containing protein [Kaistia nematophila]